MEETKNRFQRLKIAPAYVYVTVEVNKMSLYFNVFPLYLFINIYPKEMSQIGFMQSGNGVAVTTQKVIMRLTDLPSRNIAINRLEIFLSFLLT